MLCLCASAPDMKAIGVRTILDLRRMDRPCKKKGKFVDKVRLVGRYAMKARILLFSRQQLFKGPSRSASWSKHQGCEGCEHASFLLCCKSSMHACRGPA